VQQESSTMTLLTLKQYLQKIFPATDKELLISFTVFIAYFVIAKLSLLVYFSFGTSPALIWPAVGFALAMTLFYGHKIWLPVFAGHFLAVLTQFPDAELRALVIGSGYAFQAVAGLYILKKLHFRIEFEKVRNTLILVCCAFFITAIEPVIITLFQIYTGALTMSPAAYLGRLWGAGIFSVLVFTPVIISWFPFKKSFIPEQSRFRLELGAAFTLLIASNYLVFWTETAQFIGIVVIFILPAALIWFGLRFHPRWLTLAVFVTSIQGLSGSILTHAPDESVSDQLLTVQVYIGLVAAIFYVFVAVVDERRSAFNKLEEAYEKAAASDRAKNEFIAILAHELRNPLAPVASSLELLKLRNQDSEVSEVIDEAVEHTRMMRRLLDDLLDIARLGQSKIQLHKEATSIKQIIEQSLSSVKEKAQSLHHSITLVVPEVDFMLFADPVRIKQMIINLLNNSLKYTKEGGKIELQCMRENDSLVIKVVDTGIGIEQSKIEHVFEPFKQLGTASRYSSGLGIGLFLTKQLVELHGGTITAQSDGTGKGSTFTIRLPLNTELITAAQPADTPKSVLPSQTRILIVDDNESAANILQKLLRLHGHEVDVAYSGMEALQKINLGNPEVVFLDIGMPNMDGYETAKKIRATSWDGNIIGLSGFGQQSDKARALEAGFDHHLVKPAGINDILAIIAKFKAEEK
jgi:signal transduction histidine kinase